MHVENEIDRFFVLDHAAETDSGQERFAGTGLAEDAVRTLNKLFQIEADRDLVHIQRRTNREILAALGLISENIGDVFFSRFPDFREVGRHSLHWLEASSRGFDAHKHRLHSHGSEGRGARQSLTQECIRRRIRGGRIGQHSGRDAVQGDIRDHSKKLVPLAFDDHELTRRDIFDASRPGQLHLDSGLQRAAHHRAHR